MQSEGREERVMESSARRSHETVGDSGRERADDGGVTRTDDGGVTRTDDGGVTRADDGGVTRAEGGGEVATDVLVIGGGPAGIQFSRMIRQLRPEWRVVMLRPEPASMVYCAIPYAMEGLFDAEKVYKPDSLVVDAGIELVRSRAEAIDFQQRRVRDHDGVEYRYETLLIATGASPARPPIDGAHAGHVFTVKTGQDMCGIMDCLDHGATHAVVIGAGAIGIEQAQAYRQRGLTVTLVDMADHVLPNSLDHDLAEVVTEQLTAKGIEVLTGVRLASFEVDASGQCQAVVLSDGRRIELPGEHDFVCLSMGMRPDVALFAEAGLAVERDGIVVDSRMRTSQAGVYAAGDCCRYVSGIDGQAIGGKLATNAVPMAKVAARVAAGGDDEYVGFYNGHATCAYDLRIGSAGFTERIAQQRGFDTLCGYGQTTSRFPMMPGASPVRVKVVAERDSGRILGGQVLSEVSATDKVDVLTLAIQQRLTLKELSQLSYSAQPWQSFFPARNPIVQACEDGLKQLYASDQRPEGRTEGETASTREHVPVAR